ncbi:PREDICTED: serum response factor-binding protein 1 [Papilio xuthus]|uniref:Serum response factor-binding protein 1 n=1 Tax=Papilio xuthus TaxID=66420 RepID=A0AAJ6ZJA5_PAPXU|nr:PREDICTED: serum response factor-binding protein 1 [Papilio xuthus]
MEVGAVKQAFNNEIIQMKRNLTQAKIQIIHKLTRKAKTLAEKKAPEHLKEKLTKKAESAVKEVLIIKKIKAKDIAKFIVTYDGELAKYLNKPEVDHNKACARLILHKSLHEKHKYIRETFGNTSINDLFMSRLERRKMKKEAREKQKNKKKEKEAKKLVNIEGDWDVEEIENKDDAVEANIQGKGLGDEQSDNGQESDSEQGKEDESSSDKPGDDDGSDSDDEILASESEQIENGNNSQVDKDVDNSDSEMEERKNKKIERKNISQKKEEKLRNKSIEKPKNLPKEVNKKKKDINKNKNFNEKILKRKFNKVIDEKPAEEIKMADPFFITTTGESYMSVVEPRQPDEVKEIHKQGNRQYRRAVMFGHVPKPRRNDFKQENRKFKDLSNSNDRFSNNNYKNKKFNDEEKQETEKVEKLHPSWEAKKRKSGILPFEGKKIVFDDGE